MKHKKKLIAFVITATLIGCAMRGNDYPLYPESDHYDPKTQQFENDEPQRPVANTMGALWSMFADKAQFHPAKPLPTVQPDWQALQSANGRFIWFGHSTLMMHLNDTLILTDPVFGESVSPVPLIMNRFQPPVVQLSEMPEPDVVLISHDHFDHLEEATIRQLTHKSSRFIVPLGVEQWLIKWGIAEARITMLDWWQSTEINGITITAVPARHNSGRSFSEQRKTLWAGFVLAQGEQQFYYSADSSMGSHFEQIAQRFGGFNIAFIENGQYNERWPDSHLFPEQTAEVAKIVRGNRFVPIHWGAYPLALHKWNESVSISVPKARNLGVNPLTPKIGEVFDEQSQTDDWFLE